MKQSRTTVWRHRQAERAASNSEGGLPMPAPAGEEATKVSVTERYEYLERRRRHLELNPDYDAGWERPSPETTAAVCELLHEYLPSLDAIHPDPLIAQQLVVIALDVAVSAGRYGKAQRRQRSADGVALLRSIRRTVTRTRLFDMIARRYSDHYRLARETGRAFSVSQMRRSTVEAVRRDLLRQSIALPTLWNLLAVAKWPLFTLHRSEKRDGFNAMLNDGPLLAEFERLVRADPVYGTTRAEHAWRLWVVDCERPAVDIHPPIVAERAFNVPTAGAETEAVVRLQEEARVLFLSRPFVDDFEVNTAKCAALNAELTATYPNTPWRERSDAERRLRTWIRRLTAYRLEFQSIYDQVQELKRDGLVFGPLGVIPIRSAFTKVLNRRFQSAHFFPMAVSAKTGHLAHPDAVPGPNGENDFSQRLRWFAFPGGYPTHLAPMVDEDISSSQAQTLAVFLGNVELEQAAITSPVTFKARLAQLAWNEHARTGRLLRDGYTSPTDPRLLAVCKTLWMRTGYGSTVSEILYDQNNARRLGQSTPDGPGWLEPKAVQGFLEDSVPGFHAVEQFLKACRWIGLTAGNAGLILTDPLDGAMFRWDPIEAADVRVAWDDFEISIVEPGRYPGGRCPEPGCGARSTRQGNRRTCWNKHTKHTWTVPFKPAMVDAKAGILPVKRSKLRNMVAPCLVHMLDGLYAANVMRELCARGLQDFVSIHDAFYVPALLPNGTKGLDVLRAAMAAAGKPWLLALGSVYDFLTQQLAGTKWAAMIDTARARWQDRISREDWPVFSSAPGIPDSEI